MFSILENDPLFLVLKVATCLWNNSLQRKITKTLTWYTFLTYSLCISIGIIQNNFSITHIPWIILVSFV